MDLMRRLLKVLLWIELAVCAIALAAGSGALVADVIAREFFGNGIFGAQRFAVWATAIAGLVGFALVTAERGHLRPQFMDKWVPASWEPHMERVSDAVAALICIALGLYAVEFVQSSRALGERGMAIPIKVWPIQLILPWMFFSSAIRHLVFVAYPALRPEPKGEMH
jgi:TRAP-type C4-dicarboxylate transport system permease small subunit